MVFARFETDMEQRPVQVLARLQACAHVKPKDLSSAVPGYSDQACFICKAGQGSERKWVGKGLKKMNMPD